MKKIISFVFSLFKVKSGGLETKKVKKGMSKILLKTQAVKNFVDWQQNS